MAEKKVDIVVAIKEAAAAQASIAIVQRAIRGIGTAASYAIGFLKGIWDRIFSLKGLIAGAGLGFLAKSFIDSAAQTERFKNSLFLVIGNMREVNKLFDAVQDLLMRVRNSEEEVINASTTLARVFGGNIEKTKLWLEIATDLAAWLDQSLDETVNEIQMLINVGVDQCRGFKRKGLPEILGFTEGVKYSAIQVTSKIEEVWRKGTAGIKGSAGILADSWEGMTSRLAKEWDNFKNAVMDAGVFGFLKGFVSTILTEIEKLRKEGKLDEWAKGIANAVTAALWSIVWVARKVTGEILDLIAGVQANLKEIELSTALTVERTVGDPFGWARQLADVARQVVGAETRVEQIRTKIAQARSRTDVTEQRMVDMGYPRLPSAVHERYEKKDLADLYKQLMAASRAGEGFTETEINLAFALESTDRRIDKSTQSMADLAKALKDDVWWAKQWEEIQRKIKESFESGGGGGQPGIYAGQIDAFNRYWDERAKELEKRHKEEQKKVEDHEERLANAKKKSAEKVAEQEKQVQDAADARRKDSIAAQWEMFSMGANIASSMENIFAELYERSGKKTKAFLYAWKGMKMAEATITMVSAAMKALELGLQIGGTTGVALGTAMAALITGIGSAQIGLIASQKFKGGGLITGGTTPTADDVPIMASRDEYVQPASAVAYYSVGAMEAIRQRLVPRSLLADFGSSRGRFAAGGLVRAGADGGAREAPINIVNVTSNEQFERYLASRPGQRMVLNIMTENAAAIRALTR